MLSTKGEFVEILEFDAGNGERSVEANMALDRISPVSKKNLKKNFWKCFTNGGVGEGKEATA